MWWVVVVCRLLPRMRADSSQRTNKYLGGQGGSWMCWQVRTSDTHLVADGRTGAAGDLGPVSWALSTSFSLPVGGGHRHFHLRLEK